MVSVKKKEIGGNTYFYLEHSYREAGKVRKAEKYLGSKIPKNIGQIKKSFESEVLMERFKPQLDAIKKRYVKENRGAPKTLLEKQKHIFSIKFTYDSQRIEGSTLTLRETSQLIEEGVTPSGKSLDDVKEAEAHDHLFLEILDSKRDLSRREVLSWHYKLFKQTKKDIAGKVRRHQVAISGSKFMPPSPVEIEPLLKDFFRWYNEEKDKTNPVELAALSHLKFVTIHPFADGNGRISRLIMNHILNQTKYPLLNIPYAKRTSYYNSLERAQTKNQEHVFTNWLIKRYIKEHKKYLK